MSTQLSAAHKQFCHVYTSDLKHSSCTSGGCDEAIHIAILGTVTVAEGLGQYWKWTQVSRSSKAELNPVDFTDNARGSVVNDLMKAGRSPTQNMNWRKFRSAKVRWHLQNSANEGEILFQEGGPHFCHRQDIIPLWLNVKSKEQVVKLRGHFPIGLSYWVKQGGLTQQLFLPMVLGLTFIGGNSSCPNDKSWLVLARFTLSFPNYLGSLSSFPTALLLWKHLLPLPALHSQH